MRHTAAVLLAALLLAHCAEVGAECQLRCRRRNRRVWRHTEPPPAPTLLPPLTGCSRRIACVLLQASGATTLSMRPLQQPFRRRKALETVRADDLKMCHLAFASCSLARRAPDLCVQVSLSLPLCRRQDPHAAPRPQAASTFPRCLGLERLQLTALQTLPGPMPPLIWVRHVRRGEGRDCCTSLRHTTFSLGPTCLGMCSADSIAAAPGSQLWCPVRCTGSCSMSPAPTSEPCAAWLQIPFLQLSSSLTFIHRPTAMAGSG